LRKIAPLCCALPAPSIWDGTGAAFVVIMSGMAYFDFGKSAE
jgi:hypothetical protein